MSDIPVSLPTVATAASLCGALALAGLAGNHVRPRRFGQRFWQGGARGDAWWLGLAGGAGALWLGAEAILAVGAEVRHQELDASVLHPLPYGELDPAGVYTK